MRVLSSFPVAATLVLASALSCLADDWVAERLRGGVFTFVDGGWIQLHRGDVVPDHQVVRTQGNGRVTFVRGAESVVVGPDTQIEIVDRDGEQYTTVKQWYGTVEVEAEVRDVAHFEVRTKHMAAVVKGTRFVVMANDDGSEVEVKRGHVAVENSDTHHSVTIAAGQSASTLYDGGLVVEGSGSLPPIFDANGQPVEPIVFPQAGTGPTRIGGGDTNSGDGTEPKGNSRGQSQGHGGNDNNGSGPGNNGNGNAYGHDNGGGGGNGSSSQGNDANGSGPGNNGNGNANGNGGYGGNSGQGNGVGTDNNGSGPGNNGQGNANGHDKKDK